MLLKQQKTRKYKKGFHSARHKQNNKDVLNWVFYDDVVGTSHNTIIEFPCAKYITFLVPAL